MSFSKNHYIKEKEFEIYKLYVLYIKEIEVNQLAEFLYFLLDFNCSS